MRHSLDFFNHCRYKSGTPLACDEAALLTPARRKFHAMAEEQLQETHYIYKMRCCVTLMSYVGRTKHPGEQRKAEHRNGSSGKKLRAAIELYGFDSFSFEIIYECHSKAQACKYERLFIALLGTAWPNGYNIMGGGPGSLSRVATEDSKKRMFRTVPHSLCNKLL